ncbi:pilus assembly protein TadE [Gordonia jinghuaiqii]|uniref:Pilus assembly protein TadE n=1 Tax=Gordonia jinghuaiqii TaxID=2758710 RepID=A0A7D7LYR0_9ACTN|nr:TadE family type IV pilus minor pilin [Gordonia jinghuaiqii]MCR5980208.1 pilus assembly protein TadE [Gordonia jinghuaiqii]QMT02034.1 pilus assembly protein TadE [Gordonia jinghuaiqii]
MVTVEAAYAISAIVVAVLLAVGAIAGVTAQIRCTDAAREGARLTASGDASARHVAERIVGDGARVSISEDGERVVVDVRTTVPLLPGLTLSARAIAAKEPRGEDQVVFAPGVGP